MANNMKSLPEDVKKMLEALPEERRAQLEQQLASMSPEQIKMMMAKMKEMSPEEREAQRKKRASMTPEELAELSRKEEKQRMMQLKMQEMRSSGKGGKAKAGNFKASFFRLASYLGRRKGKLALVIISAILATLLSVLAPFVLAKALDVFQSNITTGTPFNYKRIGMLVIMLGLIYLLNVVFTLLQNRTMTALTQETIFDMRKEVDHKLMRLPFNYFDSKPKGDTLSRITNDIDNIGTSMQQSVTQIVTSVLTISGCLIIMFTISWQITLACTAFLAVGIWLSRRIMSQSQKYFKDQWQTLGELNGLVEETFSGMNVVKAFGCENKKIKEFEEANDGLYGVSRKAQFYSSLINPASTLFNNLSYVFICVVGALSFIKGTMSLGNISAMIQYQKQYSTPVTQLASVLNALQSAVASAERVFELLDEKEEVETSDNYQKLTDVNGKVEFEHLKFGYTPDKLLMEDIDVSVKPGQMVAIVGPTGAGKTTLVNLLMRFYETNGGSIKIDGLDTRQMTRHDLREVFGMVLQDTWLYSGTIYENIAYGNKNATKEQVEQAARSAQIEFFFETMPDKYETMINEDASNLSQGQKQLITIARAMVADPKILILDEATSSVDTRTELLIQQAMANLLKGRTSFVIAHRLSTIKDADLILYMEQGNIVEQGTHESLMEQGGKYAELYNSQFATEEEEFHGLILHDFDAGSTDIWKYMLESFGKERGIPVRYSSCSMREYQDSIPEVMMADNPPALIKMKAALLQRFNFLQDLFESLDDMDAVAKCLNDRNVIYSHDGRAIGLPYSFKAEGLLYNSSIMNRYFALTDRQQEVSSMESIRSQKEFLLLVEDVYKHKDELGIKGVFPTCSFASNNDDEQWKSFMMAMPIFYELSDKGVRNLKEFDFKYNENTKTLYDMFFKYSAGTPEDFEKTTLAESERSFLEGEVPMMFYLHMARENYIKKNRLETDEQLSTIIKDEDLGIMPLYFGHKGEASQNISIGTAWDISVNRGVGEEQKKYAKEFIEWMLSSKQGQEGLKKLGYVIPYKGITKEDVPPQRISQELFERMTDERLDELNFGYTIMPIGPFRSEFSANLLKYAKGEMVWDEVCAQLKGKWGEASNLHESNLKKKFAQLL